MKRCLLILLLLQVLYGLSAHAQQKAPDPQKSKLRFSLFSGYQQENFRWSIAGNTGGTDPNIYSELTWKKLAGPVAGAEGEWNCWKSFLIRSAFSRLFIVSGNVTDMDYQGNDRTNRSYYGAFNSNKGSSSSWRTTLEYKWALRPSFSLIPGLGYAYHAQSLFISSDDAVLGNNKLRSTYATTCKGATLGIRAIMALGDLFSIEPSLAYDQVKYRGQADWNLIATFRHPLSFEDVANGYHIEAAMKGSYAWKDYGALFLVADYFYGNTGKGTDRLYQTNGQEPLTQFNGAGRHCWGIRAGGSFSVF